MDEAAEAGIAGGEVLCAVVEEGVGVGDGFAAGAGAAAGAAAFIESDGREILVGEGAECCRAGDACADDGDGLGGVECGARGAGCVAREVDAGFVVCEWAGADGAEDWLLGFEGAVEEAEGPEEATVGVWVVAVEREAVVEVDEGLECLRGRRGPFGDGFGPGHADVVVEFAVHEEGALAGVPEFVAGCGGLGAGESFP